MKVTDSEAIAMPGWPAPLPSGRPITRLRHVSQIYAGGTPDRSNDSYWNDGSIPWLSSGEVNQWRITTPTTFITKEAFANSSAKWIPKESLVIALAGQGKTKGMVAQLEIDATCNQSLAAIVPDRRVHSRYLLWWLTAHYELLRNLAGGELRDGLNLDIVGDIPCPLPPLAEQRAIADYLDRETARIDALIAAKRRMADLLAERWAGRRHHLIWTAGSARKTIQLRRVARVQAGAAFPHAAQGAAEGTIPYVKVGDLSNVDEFDRIRGANNYVTPEVARSLRSPILPAETIVLPKIGAALLTNRRAILCEPSCLDQNVMGVQVGAGHPAYVYYCLSTLDLGEISTPGPIPLLNEEACLSVRIPWPEDLTQQSIAAQLDTARRVFLATSRVLTRQIELLVERRFALVTAAVMGELPIPEAVA